MSLNFTIDLSDRVQKADSFIMSDYLPIGGSKPRGIFERRRLLATVVLGACALLSVILLAGHTVNSPNNKDSICSECAGFKALRPAFNKSLNHILYNQDYKMSVIEKLAGAVKIPTEIFDFTPSPSDDPEAWVHFQELHEYLETQFPYVYEKAQVEKIDGFGLLFTWQGSKPDLKPLLLMAHQDVVPVEPNTVDMWTHPPFSGFYNSSEDLIYGRGTADIKQLVVSHLEAVERLMLDGFKPQRTIMISFGCDEEASGSCAAKIAQHIEKRYGANSIYAILDEGGQVGEVDGVYFAEPVTSEKGYLDAEITVFTPGGHSSVPPDHTSIGILGELIVDLEKDPYDILIEENNPALETIKCFIKFGAIKDEEIAKHLSKNNLKKLGTALDNRLALKYLFKTSQALDIVSGGIKANALPESATVLVNNRIGMHSSVNETLGHIMKHVQSKAETYDLGIKVLAGRYSKEETAEVIKPVTESGRFVIRLLDPLEPAPFSPTSGSQVWDIISGTTVSTYKQKLFGGEDAKVYITPALSTGNTDTKSFWNLTRNIYRYSGSLQYKESNEHTVDEKNSGLSLLSGVAFMYQYIPNVDAYATDA